MDNTTIRVEKVENGYLMQFFYNNKDGKYIEETYIATTKAKLLKMVKNTINMIDKETVNAD